MHRALVETDAEPKLTYLYSHPDPFDDHHGQILERCEARRGSSVVGGSLPLAPVWAHSPLPPKAARRSARIRSRDSPIVTDCTGSGAGPPWLDDGSGTKGGKLSAHSPCPFSPRGPRMGWSQARSRGS